MPKTRCFRWLVTKINKNVYTFYLYTTGSSFYPHRICTIWDFFRNIYTTTIDSYSRVFQIKIFYKIIATKKYLTICNITKCSLCRFCDDDEEEDLIHLLYFCPYVAQFWSLVQKWLLEFGIKIDICPMNIILGILEGNSQTVVNTVILVGKMFLFLM